MSCAALRVVLVLVVLASIVCGSSNAVRAKAQERELRILTKARSKTVVRNRLHLPRDLLAHVLDSKRHFNYPLPLPRSRERRGASGGRCGLPESAVLEHDPQGLAETAESIQAMWVGRDEILIIASGDASGASTTVWIGTPKSYGVFSFTSKEKVIAEAVSASSLQVSPASNRVAVVISSNHNNLYISRDAGHTWDHYKLPKPGFDPETGVHLSNLDPRVMVLHTNDNDLFITRDAGQRWEFITRPVHRVQFAFSDDGKKEFLYYYTGLEDANFHPLFRMDLNAGTEQIIDHSTYRFSVDNRYLFVSRQNATGNAQTNMQTRRLYVSSNYGAEKADKVRFTEVQLPSLKKEQLYIIMATHESGAFIHVNSDPDSPSGALYVSDSSGSRFSLSLDNHLYRIIDLGIAGSLHVDDFYEVESARGVYITTTVTATNNHVTMITFDNGGLWQKLTPPSGSSCLVPDCSLHIHLQYSRLTVPLYNNSYTSLNKPLSVKTAVGIIIAHGSIGPYSNINQSKLVISNDGGYTWKDPGLPQGVFVYGIADYGNIIAIARDSEHTEFIWFSHDRGNCFVKEQLDSTNAFALMRGLLFDPSASSLYGFLMGVEGTGRDDEWRMITINFGSLLSRKCSKTDYELVVEHESAETCLMGYKNKYNLTKQSSICYNEAGYNYSAAQTQRCDCTYSDFECDYGFIRDGDSCKKDPKFSLSSVCPPGAKTYDESKSGFRLVPGDLCLQTDDSMKKTKTVQQSCTGHEKGAGRPEGDEASGSSAGKVIGGIVVAGAILLAAAFCLYGYLKCRNRPTTHERVLYQRLPVTDSRFSATEDSESDEDLLNAS